MPTAWKGKHWPEFGPGSSAQPQPSAHLAVPVLPGGQGDWGGSPPHRRSGLAAPVPGKGREAQLPGVD